MRIEDFTFEVRDENLNRLGQLLPSDLVGWESVLRFNNVGVWGIELVANLPMAQLLSTPGYGIVVTHKDAGVILSGPTVSAETVYESGDPIGVMKIAGVDDSVILADRLAYPDPAVADASAQTQAYDSVSGIPASTAMIYYVEGNLVPGIAPTGRAIPSMTVAANPAIGSTVAKSARFDVLGELLTDIASIDGLGFDIKQVDGSLEFRVFEPVDRTGEIRMDVANQTLAKTAYGYGAPELTRAIVAGQGEGVDRTFVDVTTTESLDAENLFARRIESFIDQRNTADSTELTQAGLEKLAAGGTILTSVDVIPSSDLTMRYGQDWNLGDRVTVVVANQEVSATVTQVSIRVESNGIFIGATVGEPNGVDFEAIVTKKQTKQQTRINALERKESAGGSTGPTLPLGGTEGQILTKLSATDGDAGWLDNAPDAERIQQYVKNNQGASVSLGQAVYIDGADGTNATIKLAKADAESTSSKTLGLLAQNLEVNNKGYVVTEGILSGLDTSAATDGDPVWLSPTTAGGLVYGLANKPIAPNHLVFVGFVVRANPSNGEIYVKVQNGFENDELHDRLTFVSDTAPANPKDYYFWLKSNTGELFFRFNDGNSSQWIGITANSTDVALTNRVTALESTTATTTARVDAIRSGYYIRQAFTEIDTTGRTAGTGWTLGPTFSSRQYKANSLIRMSYHVPMRNDAGGWGGIRIEPQVAINGVWYQLGNTGHEMMGSSGAEIMTYHNMMILNFGQTSDFTAQFRFYFKSYEGTVGWNNGSNHDINASGTGTQYFPLTDTQNMHYMHMNIEELATGQ